MRRETKTVIHMNFELIIIIMVPVWKVPALQKFPILHGRALCGETQNGLCPIVRNCPPIHLRRQQTLNYRSKTLQACKIAQTWKFQLSFGWLLSYDMIVQMYSVGVITFALVVVLVYIICTTYMELLGWLKMRFSFWERQLWEKMVYIINYQKIHIVPIVVHNLWPQKLPAIDLVH